MPREPLPSGYTPLCDQCGRWFLAAKQREDLLRQYELVMTQEDRAVVHDLQRAEAQREALIHATVLLERTVTEVQAERDRLRDLLAKHGIRYGEDAK